MTTAPGFEFPNAARESDRIVAIALADSAGFTTRLVRGGDVGGGAPRRVLAAHPRARSRQHRGAQYLPLRPRVHRGARAASQGAARRGAAAAPRSAGYPSRMQVAERSIAYRRYAVTGRHIVDTWILAQLYDVAARDLPSYGLKDVARHFGVAAPERTYLPPEDIPRIFRRGARAAHGLCPRRRDRDALAVRHPVAAVLRPGPGPAVRLSDGGAAGQCHQDRRAAPARVPAPSAAPCLPRRRAAESRAAIPRCFIRASPATSCTSTSPRSIPP